MADVAAMDIVIGANVQKAIAGLEGLSTELADLSKTGVTSIGQLNRAMETIRAASLKTTDTATLVQYNKALKALEDEARRLKSVGLDDTLDKIGKSGVEAAGKIKTNFTGLTRVIQDLPFGFIAISNNLEQLLPAAGGIGLAFSAVVSALTFAQTGLANWTRGSKEAKKTTDDLANAIDSLSDSTAQDMLKLSNLRTVAQDTNQNMQIRLAAVQKLKSEYPNYLKNLSDEKILAGNVGTAYEDINKALFAKFALEAAKEKVTPLLKEQLEATLDLKKAEQDVNTIRRSGIATGKQRKGLLSSILLDDETPFEAERRLKTKIAGLKTLIDKIQLQYSGLLKVSIPLDIEFREDPEKTKKDIVTVADVMKDLKNELDFITLKEGAEHVNLATERINALEGSLKKLVEIKAPLQDMVNVIGQIQVLKAPLDLAETQKNISKQLPEIVKIVKTGLDEQFKDLKGIDFFGGAFFEIGDDANEKTKKRNKENADIQKKQLENAMKAAQELQGVFSDIFNSLAQGGQNAIQTLLHSLEQLIIKLAAAAAAAAVIQFLFNPTSEITGKALGFAGIFKSLFHLAEGGIVTGPTRALIGEAGPEVVFPLDRLREFIQPAQAQIVVLETRVRGSDIWLSQSRTNERMGRTY